jgi:hypothetical protein
VVDISDGDIERQICRSHTTVWSPVIVEQDLIPRFYMTKFRKWESKRNDRAGEVTYPVPVPRSAILVFGPFRGIEGCKR